MCQGRLVFFALLVTLGLGCTAPELPGETSGTFDIVGSLEQNGCGDLAVPAPDPLVYFAEVREDEIGRAWWRIPDQPPVGGVFDGDREFRFRSRSSTPGYPGDVDLGTLPCAFDMLEEIRVTVPADLPLDEYGAPIEGEALEDALSGTDVVTISVTPGFDCTPSLAAYGGPFATLPCTIEYTVEGTLREPF